MSRDRETTSCLGCFVILIVNLTLGAYCVHYDIACVFGADAPIWPCVVAGAFLGEIVVPIAIVLWVVGFVVRYPMVHAS